MFPNQAACFGAEFEDGERRCVVDIHRCAVEVLDTRHQLVPLNRSELSRLDFLAFKLTDIAYKSVDKLKIGHFKREYGDGDIEVDRHVLSH